MSLSTSRVPADELRLADEERRERVQHLLFRRWCVEVKYVRKRVELEDIAVLTRLVLVRRTGANISTLSGAIQSFGTNGCTFKDVGRVGRDIVERPMVKRINAA